MIRPLLDEVERLRQVMQEHRDYLKDTESATRYAVIDPVLRLLGWDVHDAATVKPEYRAGSASTKFVDYALLSSPSIVALIEAKPLGTKLRDQDLEQLSNYCVNCRPKSVQWGILTSGDEWALIDAFKVQEPLQQRVVLRFSVRDGEALHALHEVVSLFGLIAGKATERPSYSEPAPASASEARLPGDQPITALEARAAPRNKPNVTLVFPDGSQRTAREWSQVLAAVLGWLQQTGRLTAAACPMADRVAGGSRLLVNSVPQHGDGRPFPKVHKTLPGGLYYHTNYDGADCCRNAVHALEHLGVPPDTVRWRPLDQG